MSQLIYFFVSKQQEDIKSSTSPVFSVLVEPRAKWVTVTEKRMMLKRDQTLKREAADIISISISE